MHFLLHTIHYVIKVECARFSPEVLRKPIDHNTFNHKALKSKELIDRHEWHMELAQLLATM